MLTNYLGNEQTVFTLTTGKEFVLTNCELDELLTTNDKYMNLVNECRRLEKQNKELEQENNDLESYRDNIWELKDELDTFHKQEFIFENCKFFNMEFINNKYRFIVEADKDFTSNSYIGLIEQVWKYLKEKEK